MEAIVCLESITARTSLSNWLVIDGYVAPSDTTVCTTQCTVFTVHYSLYRVKCTLYIVNCILFNEYRTLNTVHCKLYHVPCLLYTIHYSTNHTCHHSFYTDGWSFGCKMVLSQLSVDNHTSANRHYHTSATDKEISNQENTGWHLATVTVQ